jgi:hypothetical protein
MRSGRRRAAPEDQAASASTAPQSGDDFRPAPGRNLCADLTARATWRGRPCPRLPLSRAKAGPTYTPGVSPVAGGSRERPLRGHAAELAAIGARLDEVRSGVGSVFTESGGRLAFGHDLIREAVRASSPVAVRRALDRQAADVLVARGALPVEVAQQLADCAERGDEAAIAILLEAAGTLGSSDPAGSDACRPLRAPPLTRFARSTAPWRSTRRPAPAGMRRGYAAGSGGWAFGGGLPFRSVRLLAGKL